MGIKSLLSSVFSKRNDLAKINIQIRILLASLSGSTNERVLIIYTGDQSRKTRSLVKLLGKTYPSLLITMIEGLPREKSLSSISTAALEIVNGSAHIRYISERLKREFNWATLRGAESLSPESVVAFRGPLTHIYLGELGDVRNLVDSDDSSRPAAIRQDATMKEKGFLVLYASKA